MDHSTHHDVARALAGIIHESMVRGERIEIPGWGSFVAAHERVERTSGGAETSLSPPRDRIEFRPDGSESDL